MKAQHFLFFLLIVYVLGLWIAQVPVSDAGVGCLLGKSWEEGAKMGYLNYPDFGNIAKQRSFLLGFWSSGQFVLPFSLKNTFGLTLGQSTALLTCVFSLLSLWGWALVYKKMGFAAPTIWLSLLLMVGNRLFSTHFLQYTGGELLLLGITPFLLYWGLMRGKMNVFLWVIAWGILAALTVFFKLSGVLLLGTIALFLFSYQYFQEEKAIGWMVSTPTLRLRSVQVNHHLRLFLDYGLAGIVGAIAVWLQLKNLPNTLALQNAYIFSAENVLRILAAPFLGLTQLGDFLDRVSVLMPYAWIFSLLGIFAIIFALYGFYWRDKVYTKAFLIAYLGLSALWIFLIAKNTLTDLDMRHFRVLIFAALPIVVEYYLANSRRKWVIFLLFLYFSYNMVGFVLTKKQYAPYFQSQNGLKYDCIDSETQRLLLEYDQKENLIFLTCPEAALELKQARCLITNLNHELLQGYGLSAAHYQGKAKVYAFIRKDFEAAGLWDAAQLFPDLKQKKLLKETGNYKIYLLQ